MGITYQVLEDNAGGLHLAVMENGRVIYYAYGYEHIEDGLRSDLVALRNGEHPLIDGWETPDDVDDPQMAYESLRVGEVNGAKVVADQDGVYIDRMGRAARRLFSGYNGFPLALGFDDYDALMAASESVVREGDIDWYVTELPDGRWAAWDDAELALDRVAYFETREAAVQYHLDEARRVGIITEG